MVEIRADLHMHGPIGFQPYWLKTQGYEGKNLLRLIADSCFDKGIDICAITSDEDEIPRGSIHDRFNWLKDNCAKDLPISYDTDTLGKNILMVYRPGQKVFLVNGQTVRARDGDKKVDYLVVGSNEVPIGRDLEETAKYVHESWRMFGGPEHGLCTVHGGVGLEKMIKIPSVFWEGHNSQLIFPDFPFSKLPIFRYFTKGLNKKTQELAREYEKPWIATSDAHRTEDAGLSYIQFDDSHLNYTNEEGFIGSLRRVIESNKFTNCCAYENPIAWMNWVSKLMIGTRLGRDKE